MNKQKFVDYLRSPERLTEGQFEELMKLLVDYPYFSIGKTVAARAAKILEKANKNELVTSAAIHATDRKHLKRYINGELIFVAEAPVIAESSQVISDPVVETPKEKDKDSDQLPTTPPSPKQQETHDEVDQILDELQRDMEELRKSREHFVEVQSKLDEGTKASTEPAPTLDSKKEDPIIQEEPKAPEPPAVSSIDQPADLQEEPKAEKKKTKPASHLSFDLEALKRELAQEEDTKVKEAVDEEIKSKEPIEDKAITSPIPEAQVVEDEEDDDLKEPPKVVNHPGAITNMTAKEENDEDEDEMPLPRPKRRKSEKKPRAVTKIKREDLEKMLGTSKKDESTDDEKVEAKKLEQAPEEAAKEVEQPKAKTKKGKTKTKKGEKTEKISAKQSPKTEDTPVAKVDTKDEEKVKVEKPKKPLSEEKQAAAEEVKAPEETKSAEPAKDKTGTPPAPEPPASADKESKPATTSEQSEDLRASIRALMDIGRAGNEQVSISRASVSKRKLRQGRTNKNTGAQGGGEAKSGSKDDDESGGASQIIDNFIKVNPSIQRNSESGNKADLSEKSAQWNPEIASEYLAEIYAKQGNIQRATSIYEALILKFPEKKSYFAGLIEKLKK